MKKFPKRYILLQALLITLYLLAIYVAFLVGAMLPDEDGFVLIHFTKIWIYISLCVFFGVLILSILYSMLYYKTHNYEITEDEIIFKNGVIFKKKTILSFSKINNIKSKRNIFHWLFGLEVLKLDSGATATGIVPEIRLVDFPSKIKEMQNTIKTKIGIEIEEEKETEYKFTISKMFGYSYVRYSYLFTLLFVFIGVLGLVFGESQDKFIALMFVLTGVIIVPLACLIYSMIRFYKFSIVRNSNSIELSYGLFEKRKNTIYINKIRAIKLHQSFMQRILKTATLVVEIIGFGDTQDKETTDVVIPYFNMRLKDEYMKLFFKEWDFEVKVKHTSPKRSLKFYVGLPMLIANIYGFSILYLILIMFKQYLICLISFLFLNSIIVLFACLKKKNLKFEYNDKYLFITKGYLGKHTLIIDKKNIILINKQTTLLRQKENLASFTMVFYNIIGDNVETINLVEDSCYTELINLLK